VAALTAKGARRSPYDRGMAHGEVNRRGLLAGGAAAGGAALLGRAATPARAGHPSHVYDVAIVGAGLAAGDPVAQYDGALSAGRGAVVGAAGAHVGSADDRAVDG
jgi:hypothetical protein